MAENTTRSREEVTERSWYRAFPTSYNLRSTREIQERDDHHSGNATLPITNTSPQGYSIMTLHTCILALNGVLGVCIQVKFPNVSPYETADGTLMMNLFIIEICFYIISLVVMAIQAARKNADLEDLMNKISLLLGTLSLILELLVLISPFGWIALFFWSICFLCFLSTSYKPLKTHCQKAVKHLVQVFVLLKQKLVDLNRRLMDSNVIAALSCAYQKLKDLIIRNDGRVSEHQAQNQNQNHTTEV